MTIKYLNLFVMNVFMVTIFVSCGDFEDKTIVGPDIKSSFLRTHTGSYKSSSGKVIIFDKKGTIEQKSSKHIRIWIEKSHDGGFYISDDFSTYNEKIKDDKNLQKKQTTSIKQMGELLCNYQQMGGVEALYKIPREYPKDKLSYELRNMIDNQPEANFLMILDQSEIKVSSTEVLDTSGSFFEKDVLEDIKPNLVNICTRRKGDGFVGTSDYQGRLEVGLKKIEEDKIEFILSPQYESFGGEYKVNSLYKLGERVFVKAKKRSHYLETLGEFLSHNRYEAHQEEEGLVDNRTKKLQPTKRKEVIKVEKLKSRIKLDWHIEECEFHAQLEVEGIKEGSFRVLENTEVPLQIKSVKVVLNGKSKQVDCMDLTYLKDNLLSSYSESDLLISINPVIDYYSGSFYISLKSIHRDWSNRSLRFVPATK